MEARALVMTGPRCLEVRTLPVPGSPPVGGAVLKVLANGLCGSDYDLYVGRLAPRYMPFPLIPGHEVVGEIAEIHPDAADAWGVEAGDRVAVEPIVYCGQCSECVAGRGRFCLRASSYSSVPITDSPGGWGGGLAEYMVLIPGTRVHPIPDHLTDEDAVLFNPFGNAFEWVAQAGRVRPGDHVLVTGCGSRGLACAAVAKECGAAQVVVTGLGRDAHKLALAADFGADHTVDVEAGDTVEAVRDLSGGRGQDVVVDTAPGATDTIVQAIELLRNEGTLVLAGEKGQDIRGLRTDWIHRKALTIRGAFATSPWSTANAVRLLAEQRYPFSRLHTHTVGLDGVEHAIRALGGEVDGGEALHTTVDPTLVSSGGDPCP